MKNRIFRQQTQLPPIPLRRRLIISSALFLLPISAAFFITFTLPPDWRLNPDDVAYPMPEIHQRISSGPENPQEITLNREIQDLLIEKRFWKNRLATSNRDSFSLAIDLVDSTITLEIQGVPVRECQIEKYKTGRSLNSFRRDPDFLNWIGAPFTVQNDTASIDKAPVVVIHAPRDTLEAQALLSEYPQEADSHIQITFHLDRNLQVDIRLSEPPPPARKNIANLLSFDPEIPQSLLKIPGHFKTRSSSEPYQIIIYLSKSDAKAIYRALPDNAQMSLRM